MSEPNPQPIGVEGVLPLAVAEDIKRSDCVHYDACLDVVIAEGWPQFHCGACRAYARRPEEVADG